MLNPGNMCRVIQDYQEGGILGRAVLVIGYDHEDRVACMVIDADFTSRQLHACSEQGIHRRCWNIPISHLSLIKRRPKMSKLYGVVSSDVKDKPVTVGANKKVVVSIFCGSAKNSVLAGSMEVSIDEKSKRCIVNFVPNMQVMDEDSLKEPTKKSDLPATAVEAVSIRSVGITAVTA